jgi:hypothetical protein
MIDKKVLQQLVEEFKTPREEFGGKSYMTRRREWFEKLLNVKPLIATPEAIDHLTRQDAERLYNEITVGGPQLYPRTFLENGIDKIKQSLKYLLHQPEIPLEKRFYDFVEGEYRLSGVGRAFASTALFILDPQRFGIWNAAIDGGLEMLSRLPPKRRGEHKGQRYLRILETLKQLQKECDFEDLSYTDEFVELIYHGKLSIPQISSHTPLRDEEAKEEDEKEDETHDSIQWLLIKIGRLRGHDVWVAKNDRNKSYNNERFSDLCLAELPHFSGPKVLRVAELIDVIWFKKNTAQPVWFFEIEHSTSIYSGLLRLNDVKIDYPIPKATIVGPESKRSAFDQQTRRRTFEFSELSEICNFKTYEEIKDWFNSLEKIKVIEEV